MGEMPNRFPPRVRHWALSVVYKLIFSDARGVVISRANFLKIFQNVYIIQFLLTINYLRTKYKISFLLNYTTIQVY